MLSFKSDIYYHPSPRPADVRNGGRNAGARAGEEYYTRCLLDTAWLLHSGAQQQHGDLHKIKSVNTATWMRARLASPSPPPAEALPTVNGFWRIICFQVCVHTPTHTCPHAHTSNLKVNVPLKNKN